jgi:pimeloyl-ACP methyl ester carboxylesterase
MRVLAAAVIVLAVACRSGERPGAVAVDTLVTSDGVSMVYDVRGSGDPTLVFIHCWACDREFWRGQLDSFAVDHRVVALDLPGHGLSGRNRAQWSITGLGADVAALVTALDLPRVVLVGHSMGAPVALAAASRLRGKVAGVVCVDALQDVEFRMDDSTIAPIVGMLSQNFAGGIGMMMQVMFAGSGDTATARWVQAKAVTADTGVALPLMRSFGGLDFATLLADAGAPVRCINAVPVGPMAIPTRVDNNRKYGDFDAVMMDSVGHFLHLERPAEFNARLREILATLQ